MKTQDKVKNAQVVHDILKKKNLTTVEAFKAIIYNRDYITTLPIPERNKIASYRTLYEKKVLKMGNIDSFLEKHGYSLKRDKVWSVNN